jgi:hypothetical protein
MTKITCKQLREELEGHGWKAKLIETENFGVKRNSTVFQNSNTNLYIILPRLKPTQAVQPIHLLHVRNVLENAGLWNSLIRQNGANRSEETIHVIRTLAAIKNGK